MSNSRGVLEFKVVDTRIFEEFYSHVLEGIAGSTLYASSLASERFFWRKENPVERYSIPQFIQNGGKMIRFFLTNQPKNTLTKEELAVVKRHFYLYGAPEKGGVFVVWLNQLERAEMVEVDQLIATEESGLISWELQTTTHNEIRKAVVTTSFSDHKDYMKIFAIFETIGVRMDEIRLQDIVIAENE